MTRRRWLAPSCRLLQAAAVLLVLKQGGPRNIGSRVGVSAYPRPPVWHESMTPFPAVCKHIRQAGSDGTLALSKEYQRAGGSGIRADVAHPSRRQAGRGHAWQWRSALPRVGRPPERAQGCQACMRSAARPRRPFPCTAQSSRPCTASTQHATSITIARLYRASHIHRQTTRLQGSKRHRRLAT